MQTIEFYKKHRATAAYLRFKFRFRYAEDAVVNGKTCEHPAQVPLYVSKGKYPDKENYIVALLNLETGVLDSWLKGVKASFHLKGPDGFTGTLISNNAETIFRVKETGVPGFLSRDDGDSDYLVFDVNGNGEIVGWNGASLDLSDLVSAHHFEIGKDD